MTFAVSGDAYDRYMGRYSRVLAPSLADFASIERGSRALDVGCGPGALTAELARRLGVGSVIAADPSESFVAACAGLVPGVDVRVAAAESLPWPDDSVDAALAQLVVNFLEDPAAGLTEMRRLVRPGGVVAACTWDYSDGMRMLRMFWDAALTLDPEAPDESRTMRYQDPHELTALWRKTHLEEVETAPLDVEVEYRDFDDFWEPFLLGVGPGGAYCTSLSAERQVALREECRRRLGDPRGPFAESSRDARWLRAGPGRGRARVPRRCR